MSEKYGSYEVIEKSDSHAIGRNKYTQIQPYVTWAYCGEDVTSAIFHESYRLAKEDFDQRESR